MALVAISAAGSMATANVLKCPKHPKTRAAVLAVEGEWVKALESRDSAGLACALDPRFADSTWRGTLVAKSVILANLQHRMGSKLELSDLHVDLAGDVAVARGINKQTSSDGVASIRFTDIFIYEDGSWRAIAAQETMISADR